MRLRRFAFVAPVAVAVPLMSAPAAGAAAPQASRIDRTDTFHCFNGGSGTVTYHERLTNTDAFVTAVKGTVLFRADNGNVQHYKNDFTITAFSLTEPAGSRWDGYFVVVTVTGLWEYADPGTAGFGPVYTLDGVTSGTAVDICADLGYPAQPIP